MIRTIAKAVAIAGAVVFVFFSAVFAICMAQQ